MTQKSSLEALELSARNIELVKRNKHHHHLGPGGYYAKEEQFRKIDEEAVASGNIDVKNLKVHSRNWMYARSTESFDSNFKGLFGMAYAGFGFIYFVQIEAL